MLVATKKLAFRSDTFASGKMYAAIHAPHHILALKGWSLLMRLFLPFFERPPIAPYHPDKEHSNKGEE